jgi:Integrase zinc binding domain
LRELILETANSDSLWLELEKFYQNEDLVRKDRLSFLRNFSKLHGLWSFQMERLYVPEGAREHLLKRYHDSLMAGHQGAYITSDLLVRKYFWPGLMSDVKKWVRSCDICQRRHTPNRPQEGYLQPLPIPELDIGIDFFEMPKASGGEDFALIIVDRLSKYTMLLPCSKKITSKETAELFMENWFLKGFGLPVNITSDMDT